MNGLAYLSAVESHNTQRAMRVQAQERAHRRLLRKHAKARKARKEQS